jgi:FkbM family methyltransferase
LVAHLWKATTQQHHRALMPLIAHMVPRDGVVFDVGAHAGQFAKLFSRAAGPEGRVYAFEPGSYARSILRTVVWTRRLRNVAIVPLALGDASRVDVLTMPVKASGANAFGLTHLGRPEARWPTVSEELVAQTTIDETATALALDRLDFIKADIEGWELRLLHGAGAVLDRFRPRLMIELNDAHLARAGDSVADAFAFLTTRGYRAFAFREPGALVPVTAPRDGDFWFLREDDPLIARLCS